MKRTVLWILVLGLGAIVGVPLAMHREPVHGPEDEVAPQAGGHQEPGAVREIRSRAKSAVAPEQFQKRREDDLVLQELQISGAEREHLLKLLRAIREANSDVSEALNATDVGTLTPDAEALRSEVTKPLWEEVRELLGQERYDTYWMAYQRVGIRGGIEAMLRSSRVLITDDQLERVIDLALESSKAGLPNPMPLFTLKMVDWEEFGRKAAGILTPDQIAMIERTPKWGLKRPNSERSAVP